MNKKRGPRSESFYKWHTERIRKNVIELEKNIKDMELDYYNTLRSDDDWRAREKATDLMNRIIKTKKALARKRKSLIDRTLEAN